MSVPARAWLFAAPTFASTTFVLVQPTSSRAVSAAPVPKEPRTEEKRCCRDRVVVRGGSRAGRAGRVSSRAKGGLLQPKFLSACRRPTFFPDRRTAVPAEAFHYRPTR